MLAVALDAAGADSRSWTPRPAGRLRRAPRVELPIDRIARSEREADDRSGSTRGWLLDIEPTAEITETPDLWIDDRGEDQAALIEPAITVGAGLGQAA